METPQFKILRETSELGKERFTMLLIGAIRYAEYHGDVGDIIPSIYKVFSGTSFSRHDIEAIKNNIDYIKELSDDEIVDFVVERTK